MDDLSYYKILILWQTPKESPLYFIILYNNSWIILLIFFSIFSDMYSYTKHTQYRTFYKWNQKETIILRDFSSFWNEI